MGGLVLAVGAVRLPLTAAAVCRSPPARCSFRVLRPLVVPCASAKTRRPTGQCSRGRRPTCQSNDTPRTTRAPPSPLPTRRLRRRTCAQGAVTGTMSATTGLRNQAHPIASRHRPGREEPRCDNRSAKSPSPRAFQSQMLPVPGISWHSSPVCVPPLDQSRPAWSNPNR